MEEGKLVVQDMEQSAWGRRHLGAKEHSHVLQRKVQENIKKVSDSVEDLYRRKAWADGTGPRKAAQVVAEPGLCGLVSKSGPFVVRSDLGMLESWQ